ncbi:MAG TPA: UDP-glucose 4-epimerase GalE [Candidatus Margulisbacteria bacterium]|nr:MAG: UDP-glucose 4-epimerase GalE [Candidatus Margulisbacteria bacterium GWF2_38_17]OGI06852.1 MAG: UDP-glucose 4-epimerase GalE [Candidatus Margulisbacteria bacterium GWE2_39_32]HCT85735.1 UDP-glucose 4-epimerase GalE [Candidatus Margulisiibacteriota bacterium]
MKHILVTGGAGYIGSHTVLELQKLGYYPVVIDSLIKGHKEAVLGGEIIHADIGNREELLKVFHRYKIDAVIHFAAFSEVGESVSNPQKYYHNNIVNSINLLDVMVEMDVKKIVFSSSAAVYGEPSSIPITEDEATNPTNPYGKTKLIFEKILQDYEKAYGVRHMCLRYFNAAGADPEGRIGEDHSPESHLIPLILQVAQGQRDAIFIFGTDYDTDDGTCVRDYIHVNDLASAHILALEALQSGKSSGYYNLGNGNGHSVLEVIKATREVTGCEIVYKTGSRRPGDPARLVASSEKIKSELNWHPKYNDLHTIISHAWNWCKTHPKGYHGNAQ